METEELKKKLEIAKNYIYDIENLISYAQQCEIGFSENKSKKFKTTIARIVACLWLILCIVSGGEGGPATILIGIIPTVLVFLITKALRKSYTNEMNAFADKYTQYCDVLDKRLDAEIQCVEFLPGIYQNSDAITFIEEAIRTGVAYDLDSAIRQYHAYAGRVESQMAFAEYAQQVEAELRSIRNAIDYHY